MLVKAGDKVMFSYLSSVICLALSTSTQTALPLHTPRRPACSFLPREHFLRLFFNPLIPRNHKINQVFAFTRPAILASTKRVLRSHLRLYPA